MSFKSGYQGGAYYELLSTQGKDSISNWKVSNSGIKKIYEKDVKGYILTLEGASSTSKVQLPKDQKQNLTLIQRYLVLQIYLLKGAEFSMECCVTDLGNNKRRILLSTSQKEVQVTPLHAKLPLGIVHRGIWLNLALDMVSLVSDMWLGQTFRSLDQISISANCKLKRVFTMKSQPPDTTEDEDLDVTSNVNTGEMDNIPKQCQFSSDVEHLTQVLTVVKIKAAERIRSGKSNGLAEQYKSGSLTDLDLNNSGRKVQTSDGKIAFGSKAPRALETGRKTSRQGNVTSRSLKSQSSRNDNESTEQLDEVDITKLPDTSRHSSQVSDQDSGFKDIQIVAPHPPREPSNDRVRRKPRFKPIGQNGQAGKEGSLASPPTSAGLSGQTRTRAQFSADTSLASPPTSAGLTRPRAQFSTEASLASPPTSAGLIRPRAQFSAETSLVSPPTSAGLTRPRAQFSAETSLVSPPTSAGLKGQMKAAAPQYPMTSPSVSVKASRSLYKDSGVGPDAPDIQTPRKGAVSLLGDAANFDSVADVISLLRNVEAQHFKEDDPQDEGVVNHHKYFRGISEELQGRETSGDDDSSKSTSESSHPGEYEDSDDESSGDTNKLHHFFSPPKSASLRRTVSPSAENGGAAAVTKVKKSYSRLPSTENPSYRGARLEDDFVSIGSSDEDLVAGADMMHPSLRLHRPVGSASHQGRTYDSSNYASNSPASNKSRGQSARSRPTSARADENSVLHRGERDSVTRMSKNFLREIVQPVRGENHTNVNMSSKAYDASKYRMEDLTESFEARMYQSMKRQEEESLMSVSPSPRPFPPSQHPLPAEMQMSNQMLCESPATTSDDDTSFSTWKAPNLNQAAHNYHDEMKSQRSSDTLTSSNPRDWSGVMSPPIVPLSQVQDLQGTMEGISDELSDEAMSSQGEAKKDDQSPFEDDKLDLLFDSKLNCFYDPKTKKYYELVT